MEVDSDDEDVNEPEPGDPTDRPNRTLMIYPAADSTLECKDEKCKDEDEIVLEKLSELVENEEFVDWKKQTIELLCFNRPDMQKCSMCWQQSSSPPHATFQRRCQHCPIPISQLIDSF